mmetsp:Transcript_11743/g.27954  ORF Transcript_11743/g.27954 Transcript_11743/m.27954 type:complete len:407 (-) Transcript_11743:136-1356(-)
MRTVDLVGPFRNLLENLFSGQVRLVYCFSNLRDQTTIVGSLLLLGSLPLRLEVHVRLPDFGITQSHPDPFAVHLQSIVILEILRDAGHGSTKLLHSVEACDHREVNPAVLFVHGRQQEIIGLQVRVREVVQHGLTDLIWAATFGLLAFLVTLAFSAEAIATFRCLAASLALAFSLGSLPLHGERPVVLLLHVLFLQHGHVLLLLQCAQLFRSQGGTGVCSLCLVFLALLSVLGVPGVIGRTRRGLGTRRHGTGNSCWSVWRWKPVKGSWEQSSGKQWIDGGRTNQGVNGERLGRHLGRLFLAGTRRGLRLLLNGLHTELAFGTWRLFERSLSCSQQSGHGNDILVRSGLRHRCRSSLGTVALALAFPAALSTLASLAFTLAFPWLCRLFWLCLRGGHLGSLHDPFS